MVVKYYFCIFVLQIYKINIMISDVKVNFVVQGLGFPIGKIYKLHVWLPSEIKNPGNWVDENADKIKKELRDTCHVHSIQHTSIVWTNSRNTKECCGDIILDSEKDATPSKREKSKSKKVEVKPVKDIRKIDIPNIDKDDLNKLQNKITTELFKRENELSDDVYDFWFVNQDLVSIDEAKTMCKEHGAKDLFLPRKMEVRKKVEEKIQTI